MNIPAFQTAAAKPEGATYVDFLEAVLLERPDLKGQMAYFPAQGNLAHTVFIGNEVFKAPKFKNQLSSFKKEYDVLQQLECRDLPVPVPVVTCVGQNAYFFGMTRMPGIGISKNFFKQFTQEDKQALAKDLAEFVVAMARALPSRGNAFAIHDDLHLGNVLVDPETKKLTAIIDFGEISYISKDRKWGPEVRGYETVHHYQRLCGLNAMFQDAYALKWKEAEAQKVSRSVLGPANV